MAIPCPGCGREYDVSLFQFGRTISCTCGERVGIEPRHSDPPLTAGGEVTFMVDAMLGRLARWLRLLGFDARYSSDIDDAVLVRRAREEGRVLLTRDRHLLIEWRIPNAMLVEAERPLAQLREVVRTYDLDWRSRLFSRCSLCGAELVDIEEKEVGTAVPPKILREQDELRRCPECNKIYWPGSHTDRMRKVLEQVLEEE